MLKLSKLLSTAAMIGCCLPLLSVAQQENERWYQVELLIFSHEDSASSEQWQATPQLNYPGASRFLVFPGQNEARLAEIGSRDEEERELEIATEVDEFGRQFIRIVVVEPEEADGPGIPLAEETGVEEKLPGTETGAELEESLPLQPTPFIALPRSSREFHGKAAYMQRTGFYRTLFHETWVQPVRNERTALPLVIDRSGDAQDWPVLQGSVKLYLSRYLHLETNLWLNTQGDYLPGQWRMPPPPLGPVSVIIEQPEPVIEPEPETIPYYEAPALAGQNSDELLVDEELLEPEGPVYPWRHAILLNQKRKMRSNEVHYIDHPMLGVVVKLTPLDEEQLQEMAAAEIGDSLLN